MKHCIAFALVALFAVSAAHAQDSWHSHRGLAVLYAGAPGGSPAREPQPIQSLLFFSVLFRSPFLCGGQCLLQVG